MFLFLKLYLAHLLADFVFQFDFIYRMKFKGMWGHLIHILIHAAAMLILALPFLRYPSVWLFILAVCVIHYFQDVLKYRLQAKYPKYQFSFLVSDQIFHILFLGCVFFLPVSQIVPDLSAHPIAAELYGNNRWTLYAIAFILATFGGSYSFYNFRKNYVPDSRPNHFITPFEIAHGILERTVITGSFLFLAPLQAVLIAPWIGLIRLADIRLRSGLDFILSFIYAAAIGLIFRIWI